MEDAEHREAMLLSRVMEQDQGALEALYGLYYPKLSRFLLRMLGTAGQQALPGLINEVMFVVWNRAASFNHTSKVSSWIFGIALRVAKKHQSQQFSHESRLEGPLEDDDRVAEPWQSRLENLDLLAKALAQLPQDQQAVVELTYFNGLHYSEIARIMDCPENTVKTRMYHARLKLRALLGEQDRLE